MVKPKFKRTPEEEAKQQEADEFIRRREKLESRASGGGAITGAVREQAESQLRGEIGGINDADSIKRTVAEVQATKAEAERLGTAQLQEREDIKKESEAFNIPELTSVQKNTAAGQATLKAMGETLGINLGKTSLEKGEIPSGEPFTAVLGFIGGTSIKGVSLGGLFTSSESATIDTLNSDISKNTAEARRISQAATSKGANVQEAIKSLRILEDSVRDKYNKAQKALMKSPKDIKNGLDLADDISYSLTSLMEQRQALERYKLTGNPSEVLLLVGTQIEQNE